MKKDTLPLLVVKADPFFSIVAVAMLAAIVLVFINPTHAVEKAPAETVSVSAATP